MLKPRLAIIRGPSCAWHMDTMKDIILACVILHNMIIEDERNANDGNVGVDYDHINEEISNVEISRGTPSDFAT